jgi:hypothetical protein
LVFLIALIVTTAVLIAWVLVELARGRLRDARFPRLRAGGVQSAPFAGPALPALGASAPEGKAADRDRGNLRPRLHEPRSRREESRDDLVLYDATDVEMAVRDRLYGRHGQRG